MDAPRRLVRATLGWPVHTQSGSRRNALIASTAMAQRRREHEDVEEFLAHRREVAREVAAEVPGAGETRRNVI